MAGCATTKGMKIVAALALEGSIFIPRPFAVPARLVFGL